MLRYQKLLLILAVLVFLCIAVHSSALFLSDARTQDVQVGTPPYVRIDGQLYQGRGEAQPIPTGTADGIISTVLPDNAVPTQDDSANFGTEGMEYWLTSEGVCVFLNGQYLLFLPPEPSPSSQ